MQISSLSSASCAVLPQEKMVKYQDDMRKTVLKKAEKLEERGWKEYAGYERGSIGFMP